MAISIIIAISSVITRISLPQTFFMVFFFTISWPASYYAAIHVCTQLNPICDKSTFDDYGTNFVFLYGAVFAFVLSIITHNYAPIATDDAKNIDKIG
jgi:hypothetical protein